MDARGLPVVSEWQVGDGFVAIYAAKKRNFRVCGYELCFFGLYLQDKRKFIKSMVALS